MRWLGPEKAPLAKATEILSANTDYTAVHTYNPCTFEKLRKAQGGSYLRSEYLLPTENDALPLETALSLPFPK